MPASVDAELSFRQLAAATVELCQVIGYGSVRVWPMPKHLDHLDGRAAPGSRVVWYPHHAPLHVVAHEVAHLVVGRDGHTARWRAMYRSLCVVLLQCPSSGASPPLHT